MTPHDDLEKRLAALSPEKRALVLQRLRDRAAPGGTIPRASRDGRLPLSSAQRRLWFMAQLEGPSATYNVAAALRLEGTLDRAALEGSLREIIRRHESLRTTFVRAADGDVDQRLAPPSAADAFVLSHEALRGADAGAEGLRRRVESIARRPFDLSRDALVRATLIESAATSHVLVLVLHHIITDGWSMGLLVEELTALYAAACEGRPAALDPLPIQYADYAAWEAGALDERALAPHIAAFRAALADAPPSLELRADRPRGSMATYRGGHVSFTLDAALMRRLRTLAEQESSSVFAATLAAAGALLARHSGQDDVVLGCPMANRGSRETLRLIGFFVNTLPVRIDLRARPTFRESIREAAASLQATMTRQHVPFDRLVEALQPPRDSARTPIYQAVVSYQPAGEADLRLPGLQTTLMPVATGTAKFELTFVLDDSADGCRGTLEYNADLFDEATAARMAARYASLLEAAVAEPDSPLDTLDILDERERRIILDEWSGVTRPYPRDASIATLFETAAAQYPERDALVFGATSLTYAELDARASRVAAGLRDRGVGRGDMVAICAPRSIELVVALLGVAKAGGVYVPIDPGYPAERIAFILRDTAARVLLVHGLDTATLPGLCPECEIQSCDGDSIVTRETGGEDPAYVMYTSGSTGQPKGVIVPHRAIARLVLNTDYLTVDEGDTFLLLAPVSFDASTLEIWGALLNGARLAIAPPQALSLAGIGACVRDHHVTTLWLTSGLFNLMVDERLDDLTGVRQLFAGGDALSVPHVRRAAAALVAGRVINGYGPTESTTFTCCYPVEPAGAYPSGIPIGRPIANTRVYVLDRHQRPVPAGMAGELYAGGDGLALGYLNRDALTAAAFVPNPFGDGRLYRTGDAVRWMPDGTLAFLGRIDDQVKIRGYRVEPGEIEAALLALPGVAQAHVLVKATSHGKELIAYASPSGEDAGDLFAARLLAQLRDRLPDFMVPGALVPLPALPLNANGKVDRAALPAPDRAAGRYIAPRTPAEARIAELFRELLDVPRAGAADSFFDLGGNSLVATQLVSRIRSTLGADLALRQVFETPDVARLAAAVDALRGAEAADVIPRADRDAPLPLSFAQERLWFLNRLEPDNPFYNIAVALELHGALDDRALERALADVVGRHEILRTTYHELDGRPVQRVAAEARVPLTRLTVAREAVDGMAREEARRPFDLAAGPVIRATLLGDDEHAARAVLLLTIHHIAADGWSMGVLVEELTAAYAARVEGRLPSFAPLAVHYADFAAWQRDWIESDGCAAQSAYWRAQLGGFPAELTLPSDRPRPAAQSFRGGSIRFELDAATSAAIAAVAREHDATLFMTLLAAFAALLSRQSGQHDIVIGSPIAGRTRADLEPLVGFFVNTLALRLDLSGAPTFRDLLARARRVALEAFANQDLPFERLVDEIQPERDLSRNPLFQVMFALQNARVDEAGLPGIRIAPLDYERTTAQFDIVLDMWERPEGLLGVLEFSTDLFDHATMARLVAQWRTLLSAAVASPDTPVERLPLLTAAERHVLLDGFNANRAAFPTGSTLHALFEVEVAKGPSRIAVEHGDARLTYDELNARANRIAHRLRRLGIGRNDFVAVLLERGADFVASMLGIMKAGAAYVPIDPSYPDDRVAFMVSNSATRVLIARRTLLPVTMTAAGSDVAIIDPADGDLGDEPGVDPEHVNAPSDRAYMLYTSGSTGLPKGAILRHDGKINHIYAQFQWLEFHRDSAFLQTAPSSSDISVWQFIGPLLIGGRTVIADYETLVEPAALWALITSSRATIIELVPVAMTALLEYVATLPPEARAASALEWAMVTGEAVSPAIVNRWVDLFPAVPVVNAYGPTEAADDVCQYVLTRPLPPDARGVPIGTPLANLFLYVLDSDLQLVPIGVPGEICVSGIGVGEGYWRDEARTAAAFVRNPYAESGRGDVLYRTGDIGYWRPDGVLECLSRIDGQVKIRGFRIEVGEIEAALGQHPAVRDAIVVARDDGQGEKRLVAYVVPNAASPDVEEEVRRIREEQVGLWKDLHESEYRETLDYGDPTFNVIGWDSNYTNAPLPIEDMREYVAGTVERVLATRPKRVLEIGCGSGLIMFALLPHVEAYIGTDLSSVAIDRLEALRQRADLRARVPNLDRAVLRAGRADELAWIEPGSVDTVIFPSVLQYFPGLDYLRAVLDQVMRIIHPDGAIVFGDVRSLPLLEHFHASVAAFKAPAGTPQAALRERIRALSEQEQEMAIAPAFFTALARRHRAVRDVEVLPKLGTRLNEMTRFRYDVIVRLGKAAPERTAVTFEPWSAGRWTLAQVESRLSASPDVLALGEVPNARIVPAGLDGVDPEDLRALAARGGYDAHLSMARSGADGRFDVAFVPGGSGRLPAFPLRDDEAAETADALANDPLHERLARALEPRLRDYLKPRLPQYMVPSDFVMLHRLPTTPAGKVDRAALPAPRRTSWSRAAGFVEPATPGEQAIAAIWRDVLGVERCGLGENFFDAGGHSLKATQVISRIRRQLGVELPLRAVFAHPTIEELARAVDAGARVVGDAIPRIADAPHYPLSSAQRRLWILAQLEDGSVAYNMPASLRLNGPLDVARLERALSATVARHESLRTTFVVVDDAPRQVVHEDMVVAVRRVDLSGEADPEAAARAEALADADAPFDLEHGPLVRMAILRLSRDLHVLLFNVHHIVSDDWSMGVLIRDVMRAYEGAAMTPLRIHYRDAAAWHDGRLEASAAHRAYWLSRLAGELPVLDLPTDAPRPPVKTYRGRALTARMPEGDARALSALARQHGATPFMALVAAVKVLLYRYSGADDLIVAAPVAGREHADLEGQVGFYINTLALRDRLDPEAPFTDFLAEVTRNTAAAIEHQAYPFDRLVDELALRRDPSRMPICDVTVVMANARGADLTLPGIAVAPFVTAYDASKYDLHFVFEPHGDEFEISLVYNTDLFLEPRIARIAQHFLTLVHAIVVDPSVASGHLQMLSPDERRHILEDFNPRPEPPAAPTTLVRWFEATAARVPGRIAASLEDEAGRRELTYGALDARASRVAATLRRHGVARGVFVALLVERDLDALVGMLAILKAGGAYVPIDAGYPADRIAFIVGDAGAPVLLTSASLAARLPTTTATVIDIGTAGAEESGGAGKAVASDAAGPDDVAYVIYTSGSTGRPKGVMVTHANATRLFSSTASWFEFSEDDVWTVFHSIAFDFSVWEIWGALLYGGRAVMVPRLVARSPEAFAGLLERERVTMLNQTPSAFGALVESQARSGWGGTASLRHVIFGGEALDMRTIEPWFRAHGDRAPRLVNMYGITETTVHVTYRPLSMADAGGRSVIGAPIPDLQVYLLDRLGEPVPAGVVGEIHVGGAGVARGYWQRDDLTASRFIENPFGPGRLYRSGDLGRYLDDGDIEYLGRLDHQVKIRGFRIELGEIEAALTGHDDVRQALVLAVSSGDSQRLVAYVATGADPASLRGWLQARLPDYMVPAAIVTLPAFPLTAHGKIDRAALPAPDAAHAAPAGAGQPGTELERVVAGAFADALGARAVSVTENFFDLGAESLTLIRVHAALQERLGRKFSLVALYQHTTVRALAAHLSAAAPDTLAPALVADAGDRASKRRASRARRPDRGERG